MILFVIVLDLFLYSIFKTCTVVLGINKLALNLLSDTLSTTSIRVHFFRHYGIQYMNFNIDFIKLLDTSCIVEDDFEKVCLKIRQKAKNVNVLKIPIEMKNALEHYRNTLTSAGEYVFKSIQSDTLSTSAFNSAVKKWIVKSGLNKAKHFDITAHTFRGTFITMCIRAGVEDSKILEYTGHKDRNTLEIYKKLVAKDLEDVANVRDILRQQNTSFSNRKVV